MISVIYYSFSGGADSQLERNHFSGGRVQQLCAGTHLPAAYRDHDVLARPAGPVPVEAVERHRDHALRNHRIRIRHIY